MEQPDRLMIVDRPSWPRWPWLPLKRYMPACECGVLHADEGSDPNAPVKVYRVNVHMLARCFFPTPDMPVAAEYPNWEAFESSEWEVD